MSTPVSAHTPGRALTRAIARIVPARHRELWLAEWEGEMSYYWERGDRGVRRRLTLYGRAAGALSDALWVRWHHGGERMLEHDLRFAARSLARRPAFTLVVVLTLALGIGATTAIFSVVHGVLLRELPFADPDRLVVLRGVPTDGDSSKVSPPTSYPDLVDYRAAARSFDAIAAFRTWNWTITGQEMNPTRVTGAAITSNLLPTLGVGPARGRGFTAGEEATGAERVVILGDALWRGAFGGDPAIVGRTITLDGEPYTVVGVMPAGFVYPASSQLWLPLIPDDLERRERGVHRYGVVARLASGATRESAKTEMRAIARRLELEHPRDNAKRTVQVLPLHEQMVRNIRPAILVLFGAVALVLLIVCANVASLMLARAATREREVTVRAALGAERGTLVRQFLTESTVLAVLGGAAGIAVAWWGTRLLVANAPGQLPRATDVGLDLPVLGFALGISLLTGIAFGIAPAVQYTRPGALERLRDGRGTTPSAARRRVRQVLVVAEVALAVVLVVGAALLAKSFRQLQHVDPGFEPAGLVTAHIRLPGARYAPTERDRVRLFYEELRERVRNVPGVRDVAVSFEHPLSAGWTTSFAIEGRDAPPEGQEPEARMRPVMPGYFRTVGLRLLAGRDIAETDRAESPGVVVINESFARVHFPGDDPIGRRLLRRAWWPGMPESFEIVGVVSDERYLGLDREADPATYFAFAHFPLDEMWLTVRADGDPAAIIPSLRRTIWSLDRDLPLDDIATMQELLGASVAVPRFNAALVGIFAGIALVLAALGIYGILAHTVAERTGEIGIRMALGAPRGSVVGLVVGQGVALAALGLVIGLVGAAWASGALRRLLFQVSPTDPVVYAGVVIALGAVALVAAWLPARRASRVDPMIALRAE